MIHISTGDNANLIKIALQYFWKCAQTAHPNRIFQIDDVIVQQVRKIPENDWIYKAPRWLITGTGTYTLLYRMAAVH